VHGWGDQKWLQNWFLAVAILKLGLIPGARPHDAWTWHHIVCSSTSCRTSEMMCDVGRALLILTLHALYTCSTGTAPPQRL
jgi:hypothetical protein